MTLRWILAAVHLLALPLGLGGIHVRARGLLAGTDAGLRTALAADGYWGVAAAIWLLSGLYRAFGGVEKGTEYYVHSHEFMAKMTLFALIWVLEVWPMATLIRWRIQLGRGQAPDLSRRATFGWISHVQTALVIGMVLLATAMARGFRLF